jgi:hypothetical protein
MYKPNSKEAVFGEEVTQLVLQTLQGDGWTTLRMDKAGEGKAALFSSKDGALPAMDILATRGGRAVFVDSKGKTSSTYTYTRHAEDHGIDLACFDSYMTQAKNAGMEPWIAVYELNREVARGEFEESNTLLLYCMKELRGLRVVGREIATYGKGGMAYWNRDCFKRGYKFFLVPPGSLEDEEGQDAYGEPEFEGEILLIASERENG